MMPRTQDLRTRVSRSIMIGLAALAAAACHPAIQTAAAPSISSIVVRNGSQFDVNVYALPSTNAKPVWLATIPAAGIRSLALSTRALQSDGSLVIRTQAIGSSRSWTSAAVPINNTVFAVLDVVVDRAGDSSESRLAAIDVRDVTNAMR